MLMLPAATFEEIAKEAERRGLTTAEAFAQAFQLWLEKKEHP